jgi:polar amino acid transport system substrate-binding protein
MLKKLATLVAVLLIGAIATAHADALDTVKAHGVLRVGVEAGGTGAILSAEPGGKIVGQDADLAALIAKKLGVKLEFVETPWPGIIPALLSGRFDMIMSGMTATAERAQKVSFSTPYGDASLVAAVLAGNAAMASPANFPGKTFGVLLGSNVVDFAKSYNAQLAAKKLPPITIKTYDDIPSMLLELDNKNIDALILPRPIISGYTSKKPGAYRIIPDLGDHSYFAVAMRKDDPKLMAAVNAILMQAKADGTLAAEQTKWLGAPTGKLPDTWTTP